jgi:hypothetical protein
MATVESQHTAKHRRPGTNDERARELDAMERAGVRARRRLLGETLLGCVACCAVGLFLVSWAVHTTNAALGGVSFWTGLLTGDVGMLTLLMRHFRRADQDG